MPEEDPIELSGTLTQPDLCRSLYFHANRGRRVVATLFAIFCLLLVLVVTPVLWSRERLVDAIPYILFLLFWVNLFLAGPYRAARTAYKNVPYLTQPLLYRFSDEGIFTEGTNASSKVGWPMIESVDETKSLFLVYQPGEIMWVLPKRFFESTSQIQKWTRCIQAHLTDSKKFHKQTWIGSWL